MNIVINSKLSNCRIDFGNFRKEAGFDSELEKFLTIEVNAHLDVVDLKMDVSYELSDIKEFLNNLNKMYNRIFTEFYFQQIDECFVIKFSLSKDGNIVISGYGLNNDHSIRTNFEFNNDQSFLPDLISQVEDVIGALSN